MGDMTIFEKNTTMESVFFSSLFSSLKILHLSYAIDSILLVYLNSNNGTSLVDVIYTFQYFHNCIYLCF